MLEVGQLCIVGIVEPARDRDGVVGMEDVRSWRVVDDDRLSYRSPQLAEILYVVALVVVARLAEQAMLDDLVDVEAIQDGIGVLYGKDAAVRYSRGGALAIQEDGEQQMAPLGTLTFDRLAVKTTTS